MSIWETRKASSKLLFEEEDWAKDFISELFRIEDVFVDKFHTNGTTYSEVCGMLTLKGRNLSVILFEAILDGLSHVSMGLVREILEVTVWLEYLQQNPSSADQLSNSGFPTSGDLFIKIHADLQSIIKLFESDSKKWGFTKEAFYTPLDVNNHPWVKSQSHTSADLIIQLGLVVGLLLRLLNKSNDCLKTENCADEKLGDEINYLSRQALEAFFL